MGKRPSLVSKKAAPSERKISFTRDADKMEPKLLLSHPSSKSPRRTSRQRSVNPRTIMYPHTLSFLASSNLKYHPLSAMQEKFRMLMDLARFVNTTRGLGIQCHFCRDYNHSFSECPNVTYAKNKQLIIAKWNNSIEHSSR